MAEFIVTIEQVITTDVRIEATSAADARRRIENYGISEAAMDFTQNDTKTERIKSVRKA